MFLKGKPIRRQLSFVILLITGGVLILTTCAFCVSEVVTLKKAMMRELQTIAEIVASNSTAALAFDDPDDATETLSALKAEKHVICAALYDKNGALFARYPATEDEKSFPAVAGEDGYKFAFANLVGSQAVLRGEKRMGTLYIRSDIGAVYSRLASYGVIALLVVGCALFATYLASSRIARRISGPIVALTETAMAVSDRGDYSVRARESGEYEIGMLTQAFNKMLAQIEEQNRAINSFNQILEQKVQERTNDMELANKELEAFSYSISHDLRAPLRSIVGYSNILLEDYGDKVDDEGRRVCNVIINNGKRMGQLIDDLLDFSRMGRKEIQRAYVDMEVLVDDILAEQTAQEGDRKIKLERLPLEAAKADRSMLTQVWVNLITNALKYSRKKEITEITIGSVKEKGLTRYYVFDNGAGFDMLYIDKLFGVFQRLHKMNEFNGTGVGLALVKRIIQRHGGDVWAEAEVDKGAKFYFTLPNNNYEK